MLVRILLLVLPGALVLASAGIDAEALTPEAIAETAAIPGECANVRMLDAAAIADGRDPGTPSDRPEPWVLRTDGREVDDLSHEALTYCGRTVDGTVITLSDGTTARVPGRARIVEDEGETLRLSVR